MGSKGDISNAQSLERYLNRGVLFVQGIDPNVPKNEVLQVLNQVCKQPQQGRIDILMGPEGKNRGTAFLNFHNRDDAKAALEKWRFGLELRGRPLRMQYSSDREYKDVIQGPLVSRFKILIRNIPEELGSQELFEKFSEYGEILQVHVSHDHWGQYYAIIQYVDVASVRAAISQANREKVYNHVLLVEPYKPNVPFHLLQRQAGSTSNGGAAGMGGGSAGRSLAGSGAQQHGMTLAAYQLQQEEEQAAEAQGHDSSYYYGGVGADEQADAGTSRTSGGGGAAAEAEAGGSQQPGGSSGGKLLHVPSFYAAPQAGPQPAVTTAGSLHSLLSTALHHVHMLDELLCCPITQEPLVDPVVAADGNTYERIAIQAWLDKHDTSPLTNQVLSNKALRPNNLIRKIAEELKGTGTASGAAADCPATAPDAATDSSAMHPQTQSQVAGSMTAAAAEAEVEVAVPVPIPAVAATHVQQPNVYVVQQAAPVPQPKPEHQQQQQLYQAQVQQSQQQQQQYGVRHHMQHQQQYVVPQHQLQQMQLQAHAQHAQAAHNPFPFNVHAPAFYAYRPMGL